jgi:hypothetical protein
MGVKKYGMVGAVHVPPEQMLSVVNIEETVTGSG